MPQMENLLLRFVLLISLAVFAAAVQPSLVYGQAAGGAIAAIDEPSGYSAAAAGGGGGAGATTVERVRKSSARTASRTSKTTVRRPAPRPKPAKWDGFVVGDKYTFLNFEVISAAKPYHTREAKAGGASGLVQVEVLIDQHGKVIDARARTGNKLLHPEAERAAMESKFNKPSVYGKPARAVGFLVYRFGPAED